MGRQWLSASDKKGNWRLDEPKDFVRLEVETTLKSGVKVIPALVQGTEMPAEDALPAALARRARRLSSSGSLERTPRQPDAFT